MSLPPLRRLDRKVAETLELYSELIEEDGELYGCIRTSYPVGEKDAKEEKEIVPKFSSEDGAIEMAIENLGTELFRSVEDLHNFLPPDAKSAYQKSQAIVNKAAKGSLNT